MTQQVVRTFPARRALLRSLAPRYQQASPIQKTLLLDSFVEWTGYTRKYAIELLNHGEYDQQTIQRHRLPQYCPAVQQALFLAWKATHYVCAKRLLPSLPGLVAVLERLGHVQLTEEERRQMLAMSLSTAERYLRTQSKPCLHGLSTTTPGPRGTSQIPVRTFSSWEEKRPGFVEIDLVAHCGDHLDGTFLHTLTVTDLATGWTECIPLLEKRAAAVVAALEQARTLFPFPLLGIDTDSGWEFLNAEVIAYCEQEQLTFTRGRPGVKNDQAHVEQKNGAVVRETVGCVRLVGLQAYQQLREVYQALRLVVNCFQPSLKLQAKVPTGDRVRRVYDVAQTSLQRLLASGVLSEAQQRDWSQRIQQLDPLALSEHLDVLRYALWCGVHVPPQRAANERAWPQLGFSLAACTSVPRTPSEEGSEEMDHQKTPSIREENLALVQAHPEWTNSQFRREIKRQAHLRTASEMLLQDPGAVYPPLRASGEDLWPPACIQEDPAASSLAESHLPERSVSEACQPFVLAHPLPAPVSGMSSSIADEHEASHLAQITVEQAIAAYLQEMGMLGHEPKTVQWHQTSLRALQRYLWRQFRLTDVGRLSEVCLQSWVNDLPFVLSSRTGAPPTVSTVAAYARSARAFCNWLLRQGYVSEPLFPKEAVPHVPRGLPHPVEPKTFVRLLRACQLPGLPGGSNAGMAARNRAILWLLWDTGLQVSELRSVRLADVDCAGGTVTVCGKRGHQRTLPLSADGKRALCVYLDQARLTPAWESAVPEAQDRLLLTEQRQPLTKNSLTLLFVRLSQRAGCTRMLICPSMLRDTYAIRFLQAGGGLHDLQEQLGLADPASVRRYQRFCDEQRRAKAEAQAGRERQAKVPRSARRSKSRLDGQPCDEPAAEPGPLGSGDRFP